MNPKTQSIFAAVLLLLNASLAVYMWDHDQRRSLALLITIAVFAAVWITTRLLARSKGCHWTTSKARREIVGSIILASLILLGAMGTAALRSAEIIEGDLSKRIAGLVIGAVLVFMGNAMPKKLVPLDAAGCCATNPARAQKIQRFMAWAFVLMGLFYMAVWALLDLDHASTAVLLTLPAAIALLITVRLLTLRFSRPKPQLKEPA